MITGVQDVYYNVSDMARAVAFYRDLLGLRVLDQDDHWTSLEVGGFRVGLHWTGGKKVPEIGRDAHGAHAGATLTLKVADIDQAVTALKKRGVEFLGEISRNPWGDTVALVDPDKNVLKLMRPPA